MADIHYGSSRAGYEDALAQMKAQAAAEAEQEKQARKLGEAEQASAKAGQENIGVRKQVVSVAGQQADAIDAVSAALERETALLRTNTAAWSRSAEARTGALAAARSQAPVIGAPATAGPLGATTVGYQDALRQFEQQQAQAAAAAGTVQRAEAQAAASATAQAAARRVEEPGLTAQLLARQQYRQRLTEEALAGQPQRLLTQGGTGLFVGGPGGVAGPEGRGGPPPIYRGGEAGLGQFGPARATEDEQKMVAAQRDVQRSMAGVNEELARSRSAWQLYTAETSAASTALTRHGALSTEFIQALARGEVTLSQFGTALTSTIGKFAGWAVAGGLVYGAFEALKQVVRGATETATGVAQLERAQIPGFTRGAAEEGFRRTGARLNVPISAVSEAQFYAARAGFNRSLPETQSAGETALLAFKLDQVPIQEAARGLGAVRTAFSLNAEQIRRVFNELDVGQLKFNARLQQTLPYLGRSAAAFETAGGSIQQLVRQIVEVTGAVPGGGGGGGSGSAATFFTREPGNLRRAAAQDILRQYGFEPRQGIGDLNEALQRAARTGRTPSGIPVDEQVRYRLAEAISGGPALAGRYGIQLINAGLPGAGGGPSRAEQITKELARAEGAGGEDLKHRLDQFNEQFSAIGHTFERVGSEIGQSGLITVGEQFITIVRKMGEVVAFSLQPLEKFGSTFSELPKALQEAAIAAGALAVASRVGGFNLLAPSADKEFVRAAARTTGAAKARQEGTIERVSAERERGGEREYEIAREKQRFAQAHEAELATLAYNDPRRTKLQTESAGIDQRLQDQRDANTRTNERLVTAHERLLQIEGDDEIINNRRIQVAQKAAQLRGRGVFVAPGGISGGVVSPTGEQVGARAAAQEGTTFVAGPAGSGAKLTEALDRTAVGVVAGGSQLLTATGGYTRVQVEGAASLKEAWGLARTDIVEGGTTLLAALRAAAVRIGSAGAAGDVTLGEAGAAGRQGLGRIFGGGAGGLGSLGSRIGQNAMRGLGYAFIGSAAAEIGGELLGGLTGSKQLEDILSGVGGDVAKGAGAGALLGPEGAVAGGVLGGVAGILDKAGVFGGGTKAEAATTARLKAEQQALKEGATKNAASIEGQAAEFEAAFVAAVKDESETAVKAREKVGQTIKKLSAETELLAGTPAGTEGTELLSRGIVTAFQQTLQGSPQQRTLAAATLQESIDAAGKAGATRLKNALPFTQTPAEEGAALTKALEPLEGAQAKNDAEISGWKEELSQLQASRKKLRGILGQEPSGGRITGHTGPGAHDFEQKLEDVTRGIKDLETKIKEATGPARTNFEHALATARLAIVEASVKETQAGIKSEFDRRIAEAGNDPAAVRQIESERRKAETHAGARYLGVAGGGKKFREEENAHIAEGLKAQREQTDEQLKEAEALGSRAVAELPITATPSQIAATKLRYAASKLSGMRADRTKAFNKTEIIQAETALDEANKAYLQALETEATEIIQLRGQIRQELDYGNAVAQAHDAQQSAQEMLSVAKTAKARGAAQKELIAANNQLQAAVQTEIADIGALEESTLVEPSAKARKHIDTLRRQLASATPDEARKLQAQINDATIKLAQEGAKESESQIQSELDMKKISTQTAISRLQGLLKLKDLTAAERRSIEGEIYKLRKAATGEGTEFSLQPGSIKLPTTYDVHRALLETDKLFRQTATARGAIITAQQGNATIHNTNHIEIHVHDRRDAAEVGDRIERVTHGSLRARHRAAGMR